MDNNNFNEWWDSVVRTYGYNENPYDPMHYYDYKAAYEAGHKIPEDGKSWSSKFKHDLHPDRFISGKDPRIDKPDIEFWDTKYEKPATSADLIRFDSLRQDFERMLTNNPQPQ